MLHHPNPPRPGTAHSGVKVAPARSGSQHSAIVDTPSHHHSGIIGSLFEYPDATESGWFLTSGREEPVKIDRSIHASDSTIAETLAAHVESAGPDRNDGNAALGTGGPLVRRHSGRGAGGTACHSATADGSADCGRANAGDTTAALLIRDTAGAHYLVSEAGLPNAWLGIPARRTREGVWMAKSGAVLRLVRKAGAVVVASDA